VRVLLRSLATCGLSLAVLAATPGTASAAQWQADQLDFPDPAVVAVEDGATTTYWAYATQVRDNQNTPWTNVRPARPPTSVPGPVRWRSCRGGVVGEDRQHLGARGPAHR
jgi:uncharacterized protein (DUF3084 family)